MAEKDAPEPPTIESLPDEEAARRFREYHLFATDMKKELKRRGFTVGLRGKTPTITKTETIETEL